MLSWLGDFARESHKLYPSGRRVELPQNAAKIRFCSFTESRRRCATSVAGGPSAGQTGPESVQIAPCSLFCNESKFSSRSNMDNFTFDNPSNIASKSTIVYDPKPIAYKAVRVWLCDGSRMLGIWTGTKWWSTKGSWRNGRKRPKNFVRQFPRIDFI
jgi:hypothetical protein